MLNNVKTLLATPKQITYQIVRPFQSFFRKSASSSILLLLAALIAFAWSNSPLAESYHHVWHADVTIRLGPYQLSKSLLHWINEGLMAFFFFTVGLEIKREMLVGELASLRKALLPVAAALGGMVFPAGIYFLLNRGTPEIAGWGIPMATDIAFALGALAVFGTKLPLGLKIFLSAFAIADDLGAVFVIAVFYTEEIVLHYLFISLILILCLAVANLLWVRWTLLYAILGLALWLAVLGSGLHATLAGIIVAAFIPAKAMYNTDRFVEKVNELMDQIECPPEGCGFTILMNQKHQSAVQSIELACHRVETPLQRLEHVLHPWVAFLVIPLFALANGGLTLGDIDFAQAIASPLTLGILMGLLLGKPLGITLFSYGAVKMNLASLPAGVRWSHIIGASLLGGIGFTMSLFIALLSFTSVEAISYAKLGILAGSVLSALLGLGVLGWSVLRERARNAQPGQVEKERPFSTA